MTDRILLDTCALIWLATRSESLSTVARLAIEEADEVFVTSVTAWEIAVKFRSGKLKLPSDPISWFDHAVNHFGLKMVSVGYRTLMQSASLPQHHKDPADRTLIQFALENDLTVATGDRRFQRYGVKTIR